MTNNTTINVAAIVAPVLASRDVISTFKTKIEKSAAVQVAIDTHGLTAVCLYVE